MIDRWFIRNFDGDEYLETFLISAVTSILLIRFYLFLTDYPRIGSGEFHIAHVLFGGLLMLAAQMILMAFLTKPAYRIAAVIGGLGFGAFIDELGKFVTADNDYFFRPTVAIIYVCLVLVYLSIQAIDKFRSVSQREYLANSVELVKEAIINDLDKEDKTQALNYLRKVNPNNPLVPVLRSTIHELDLIDNRKSWWNRWKDRIDPIWNWIIERSWFKWVIIILFGFKAMTSLISLEIVVSNRVEWFIVGLGVLLLTIIGYMFVYKRVLMSSILIVFFIVAGIVFSAWGFTDQVDLPRLSITEWGQLIASVLSAIIIVIGLMQIFYSKLVALRLMKISVIISIFITQVFAFYQTQFYALFGLIFNLVLFAAVRFLISREMSRNKKDF